MEFDTSKHKLGGLCKRGHEWEDSGMSLRTKSNSECIECRKVYVIENKEKILKYKKEFHQNNKKRVNKKRRKVAKKNRKMMGDSYIKKRLKVITGLDIKDITPKMVEAKKAILQKEREQKKNTNKPKKQDIRMLIEKYSSLSQDKKRLNSMRLLAIQVVDDLTALLGETT